MGGETIRREILRRGAMRTAEGEIDRWKKVSKHVKERDKEKETPRRDADRVSQQGFS